MPPPTTRETVVHRAVSRYEAARAARDGMQVDLAVLASKALSTLHCRQESSLPSITITFTSVFKGEAKEAEVLPSAVCAVLIPGTHYYLPDWQQGSFDRDFFSLSLEQTLVEESPYGIKATTFSAFVGSCDMFDYVGVCRGLEYLGDPVDTSSGSDGQEN